MSWFIFREVVIVYGFVFLACLSAVLCAWWLIKVFGGGF